MERLTLVCRFSPRWPAETIGASLAAVGLTAGRRPLALADRSW